MKRQAEWFGARCSATAYQRALGDPAPTRHGQHTVVREKFQEAMDELLNRELGQKRNVALKQDFREIGNTILAYVCGSNELSQGILFHAARKQIASFTRKRTARYRSVPKEKIRDAAIVRKIIGTAHIVSHPHAVTPR